LTPGSSPETRPAPSLLRLPHAAEGSGETLHRLKELHASSHPSSLSLAINHRGGISYRATRKVTTLLASLRLWPLSLGRHLVGRFCRPFAAPAPRGPEGDPGRLQVGARRLPPDAGRRFNAPERPSQPPPARSPARASLCSRRWPSARRAGAASLLSTSRCRPLRWPVFRCRSLAGFGCRPRLRKTPVRQLACPA